MLFRSAANSLPQIVAGNSVNAPLFLLHGELDSVVPFSQSVRLCNALSGDPASGPAPFTHNLTGERRIINCDENSSTLHLLAQGEHALDVCIAQGVCASGNRAGAETVADSIGQMLVWMAPASSPLAPADDVSGGGGGALFLGFGLLLPLRRWRRYHHLARL